VTDIADYGFLACGNLTSITISRSVTKIGDWAFEECRSLSAVYFLGNAPSLGIFAFDSNDAAVSYYLPGATGWSTTYGGLPTIPWNPRVLTTAPNFGVHTNAFGFLITGTSNLVVVVVASADPAAAAWLPLSTNTLTAGSSYFSDPNWTKYPARFYRLRWP
jgi:hypothetical protein